MTIPTKLLPNKGIGNCIFCLGETNSVHLKSGTIICPECARIYRTWDIPDKEKKVRVFKKARVTIEWGKIVTFICDTCGYPFEISMRHSRLLEKQGRPHRCKTCAIRISAALRMLNKVDNPSNNTYATKKEKIIAECGYELIPSNSGRCKDYLTCKFYDNCLDLVYDLNWDGFKRGKRNEGTPSKNRGRENTVESVYPSIG
jgi:predicted RNA-binding Zn-ribbon protein involved in translation (DUF1610 family)